ncbi:tetratricopeptide repeat protein [candidate division WOR-3 bacterium]|nr:tetratricopeptide repeat protein [candidate division WOR-3 bacterium]
MKKIILSFFIIVISFSFAYSDFGRTTGLIDIPVARIMPGGTWRVFATGIFAVGEDDYPAALNTGFAYGIGDWGEVTIAMLTTADYAINFNTVFFRESGFLPSMGCGIHNITYRKYITELGHSKEVGYSDDIAYEEGARRPHEQFSTYFVATKDFGGILGEQTIGFGRGKYVGFGPHSHWFNTDMLFVSTKQSELLGKAHEDAFGLFFGSRWKIIEPLSVMLEFDGRDVNTGITYKFPMVELNLAWTHIEQVGKTHRPRISLGASVSSMVVPKVPIFAFISLRVYDKDTNKSLDFNVNLESAKMSRTLTGKAGRIKMKLDPGEYVMKVIIPGYRWKKIKLVLKPGETRAFRVGLEKKISKEELGREKEFDSNFVDGVTAYNNGKYKNAMTYLEKCLMIKPGHEDATAYYEKATNAFTIQFDKLKTAAEALEKKGDYKNALTKYQELLTIDPTNTDVAAKLDELTKKLKEKEKPKKPKKPKKPSIPGVTDRDIDTWYKAGLNHFSRGNYKKAVGMFEKVLRYRPGHSGAQKYLSKSRTRLKAMGEY